jgi:tetrahydromethanopterin S-methyltransferase subunit B
MGCAISIFIDDLLNGNVTANGTGFFTGLNVFSSSLTYLNNNLTDINTYLADLSNTAAGNTYTDVQNLIAVETDIKKIPDGLGTGSLSLNYNTPINQGALTATATTGTLASSFISTLGTYGTADSLVSKLYLSVYTTRLIMEGIKNNSNSFSTATGTIGGQISTMQTTINSLVTDISNMDSSLGSFLGFFSYPGSYGNMGMQAFYGVLIGFSFLALIGALLTVCCDKPGCRHLMYFACIFLFIGALIGFMISVLFSIFVPLFTWTCSYLSVGLASSAGFSSKYAIIQLTLEPF